MDLSSQLARGRDDDGGDVVFLGGLSEAKELLDEGDEEREGLAATGDSLEIRIRLVGSCCGLRSDQAKAHTSTTTSLFPMKCGSVAAWTGVIWPKPMVATASRIHSARGGVRASQALWLFLFSFPGAMTQGLKLVNQKKKKKKSLDLEVEWEILSCRKSGLIRGGRLVFAQNIS